MHAVHELCLQSLFQEALARCKPVQFLLLQSYCRRSDNVILFHGVILSMVLGGGSFLVGAEVLRHLAASVAAFFFLCLSWLFRRGGVGRKQSVRHTVLATTPRDIVSGPYAAGVSLWTC